MSLGLRSRSVLYIAVFLSCCSFAVVMPSLWPLLHSLNSDKRFLAWVVASYSIGEAIGALLFGAISTSTSTTAVMLIATVLGAAGSILYFIAELFPTQHIGPWLILVGRFSQGMWTGGAQAVQQSYLAKTLPYAELTGTTVTMNGFACLGFVLGPAFGLVFNAIPPFEIGLFGLHFNELTAPGYFVLLCAGVIIVLYATTFDERGDFESISSHRHRLSVTTLGVEDSGWSKENEPLITCPIESDSTSDRALERASNSQRMALVVCNVAFFTHFYGFALQETITTPLVQAYFSWSVLSADFLFTGAGLCSLIAFFGVGFLSRQISDRDLTLASLMLGAVGYILLLSTPEKPLSVLRFLAGFAIISMAFPIGRSTVVSLYTKVLPLHWQGTGQGIILAVGAVARILGPFWAVRAFYFRLGGLIVFGCTAAMFLVTTLLVLVSYPSLDTRSFSDEGLKI